jgi:hypothetical protein
MAQNDMRRPIEEPEFNVCFWHKADITRLSFNVRLLGVKRTLPKTPSDVCF